MQYYICVFYIYYIIIYIIYIIYFCYIDYRLDYIDPILVSMVKLIPKALWPYISLHLEFFAPSGLGTARAGTHWNRWGCLKKPINFEDFLMTSLSFLLEIHWIRWFGCAPSFWIPSKIKTPVDKGKFRAVPTNRVRAIHSWGSNPNCRASRQTPCGRRGAGRGNGMES